MASRTTSALARRLAFVSVRRTQRRPLGTASSSFCEGDHVHIKSDGIFGTVEEVRGSGWYSIQLKSNDDRGVLERRKIRGTQLEPAAAAPSIGNATSTNGTKVTMTLPSRHNPALSVTTLDDSVYEGTLPTAPPPTIIDLDAALMLEHDDNVERSHDSLNLQQVAHHLSYSKWVMFTDLHCAPSTLDTCLKVLERVHQLAVERNAGILFLGDWWHHRGTLRVDTLNSVLEALSTWTQPMVMIPGNHDQVTLGGHNHGLTPMQHAYRCANDKFPGPLIFSHPTIFGKALWTPHVRDNAVMESILQSPIAQRQQAVFCHADVTGASMNDLVISQSGVLPRYFPSGVPVYSGHFHKPHVVTRSHVSIEYPGSPYQVSLSEAQQEKQLLVLDSTKGWKCVERLGVDLGRKHFRVESVADFLSMDPLFTIQGGDRVIISVPANDLQQMRREAEEVIQSFDSTVSMLRRKGATVEIREIKTVPQRALGPGDYEEDTRQLEELSPVATLRSYFTEEISRETISNAISEELYREGMQLLDEMETSDEPPPATAFMDIQLSSVSLEGFGPFKDRTMYPLLDRGLVLLRGSNKDRDSDSNGTGKSSLAMAALWALTGSVDSRLVNDGKVADVVTDGCKSAKVSVHGKLNGQDFRVTRTKTSSKTGLIFFVGECDMTTQSVRETQAVIEETLGVNLQVLARTIFHGQHAINGLLEATDIKLKEELSFIVPLDVWQHAATFARSKARNATKTATEVRGMIKLREDDLRLLQAQQGEALESLNHQRAVFAEKEEAAALESAAFAPTVIYVDTDAVQEEVGISLHEIETLSEELQIQREAWEHASREFQVKFDETFRLVTEAKISFQEAQRTVDRKTMKADTAKKSLIRVQEKWSIDSAAGTDLSPSIDMCPTCLQPLSSAGIGHSHDALLKVFQEETETAIIESQNANVELEQAQEMHAEFSETLDKHELTLKEISKRRDEMLSYWQNKLSGTETQLESARSRHLTASAKLREALSSMQKKAEVQNISAKLEAEQALLSMAEARFNRTKSDVVRALEGLELLNAQAEQEKSTALTMSSLADIFGTKGVQNFVLQNAVEALQTISQAYLNELSDGSLRLDLDLDDGDKIVRRCFVRAPDGDFTERPLASLSGGQWRRCSLALSFGFMDLIARRGRLRPSLIVLDEPLTHLDRIGRRQVGALLRKLLSNGELIGEMGAKGISANTIVLILQDLAAEELEESFDHIDEVTKKDGFSSVSVDEVSS